MSRTLDWKWIAIGVAIMFGLNFLAGIVVGILFGSAIEGVENVEEIAFTEGQALVVAILSFLSFAIGGYIVGRKSSGRTILEPGISAAIAVALALLITGGFTLINLLVGGLVPFVAGLLGGWLGERQQGTA